MVGTFLSILQFKVRVFVCGGGVDTVPADHYKTKTLCCVAMVYQLFHHYQLHPPVSYLFRHQPVSATYQYFPHRFELHLQVIVLIPQKLIRFFYKNHVFQNLIFFPFPLCLFKNLFLHLYTRILCIPCVKLNTWSSCVPSKIVSIFTLNQHRIRWNVDDNTNIWRW